MAKKIRRPRELRTAGTFAAEKNRSKMTGLGAAQRGELQVSGLELVLVSSRTEIGRAASHDHVPAGKNNSWPIESKRRVIKVVKLKKYRVAPASFASVLKAFGIKRSEFESTKNYVLSRVKTPANRR